MSLADMTRDLIGLSPGFVNKRLRGLRASARRTLGLLGNRAPRWLEEFAEGHPPLDLTQEDHRLFGDWLVARTAARKAHIPHGPMVAAMARFERLENGSFWDAQDPSVQATPSEPPATGSRTFDVDRPLRMCPGAATGHFGWDLRQLRRFDPVSVAALPPDPCDLLFFHAGMQGRQVRRLDAELVQVLGRIGETPGISTAEALQGARDARAVASVEKLMTQGALRWL
jgi:hypothetical protein